MRLPGQHCSTRFAPITIMQGEKDSGGREQSFSMRANARF